jgi:hypothetical protein
MSKLKLCEPPSLPGMHATIGPAKPGAMVSPGCGGGKIAANVELYQQVVAPQAVEPRTIEVAREHVAETCSPV